MVKEKQCAECGEVKPLVKFKVSGKSSDGRSSKCKVCKGDSLGHFKDSTADYSYYGCHVDTVLTTTHNRIVRQLNAEHAEEIQKLNNEISRLTLRLKKSIIKILR